MKTPKKILDEITEQPTRQEMLDVIKQFKDEAYNEAINDVFDTLIAMIDAYDLSTINSIGKIILDLRKP